MKCIKSLYQKFFLFTGSFVLSAQALAGLTGTNLRDDDLSKGKNLSDVIESTDTTAQEIATLVMNVFALVGVIIVGVSLVSLWRASKEEGRERPMGAVVGLMVGGLCLAVGGIAWAVKNQIFS